MPNGVRSSLIAFAILTGLTLPAAAEPTTTWTDPPARQPEAAKTSPQPAVATPAAVSPHRQDHASAARAPRPSPHREAARHRVRVVHEAPRRIVAAAPRRTRIVSVERPRPVVVRRYAYPVYSYAGYPPSYEDERLDRLSSAVGSGYLVVHGRSVEYPDGRVIRFYRPADDEAE